MPDTNVRPEIVSLLTDLNLHDGGPSAWRHADGRDLTPEEFEQATSATLDEMQAAADYLIRASDYIKEQNAVITATAEHISHHFALDIIQYDLRENDRSMREEDFEPAVTSAEILAGLEQADELADSLPAGTRVSIPSFPVVIDKDGQEVFVSVDKVTDETEQTNSVLVLIAEAVALQKASREALISAIALRSHYDFSNN